MWIHEFGQHQKPEVLVILNLGVSKLNVHLGALPDDSACENRLDARLEFLLDIFDNQDTAVLQARAQLVFELLVSEGRCLEVLVLFAELLGGL